MTFTLPKNLGHCAKAQVKCTIVAKDGERFVGMNWCATPQPTCPRAPGEGYDKCKTVCNQLGHAEEVAAMIAGEKAKDAHAYIEGHRHACANCQQVLTAAGIDSFSLKAPPEDSAGALEPTDIIYGQIEQSEQLAREGRKYGIRLSITPAAKAALVQRHGAKAEAILSNYVVSN